MWNKNEIERHDAVEYFGAFESQEEGIFFLKNKAFFISDQVKSMVEVSGDPVKDVLLFEYCGGVRWNPEQNQRLKDIEAMFQKKYKNKVYFKKDIICEMLAKYKIRVKRKSHVIFQCIGNRLNITLKMLDSKEISVTLKIEMYSRERSASYSDFSFSINALLVEKILCHGFSDCDRIGLKFSPQSDIIFFNINKLYFQKFWAVSPEFLKIV